MFRKNQNKPTISQKPALICITLSGNMDGGKRCRNLRVMEWR